jgi:phosphonate transport system permease protein
MSAISAAERLRLEKKFPDVFKQSFLKRFGLPLGIVLTLLLTTAA